MLWNIFILVGKCMSCIFIVNWNFSITQKQQPYFRAYCMFHLKSLDEIYFEKCCVCKPSHVCLRPFLYSVLTLMKCSRVEFLFLITTGIEREYTAGHQRERDCVRYISVSVLTLLNRVLHQKSPTQHLFNIPKQVERKESRGK